MKLEKVAEFATIAEVRAIGIALLDGNLKVKAGNLYAKVNDAYIEIPMTTAEFLANLNTVNNGYMSINKARAIIARALKGDDQYKLVG